LIADALRLNGEPITSDKTWLACALAQQVCRAGHGCLHLRVPRLAEEPRALHGSGGFGRWLPALAKTDVLVLYDRGVSPLDAATRSDLMEIIDDRAALKATIMSTQLPIDHWHGWIGDASVADAILDRLMRNTQHVVLRGQSTRRPPAKRTKPASD
jgi:DNA replication protein DnaC